MFLQSLRMTLRDWRAGELRFLLAALVVAVAALASVGFFVDRMRTGMSRDAHQLLGADLLVGADQPLAEAWKQEARTRGLRTSETVVFPSMAQAGEDERALTQLASLKAVAPGYPLRGRMSLAAALPAEGAALAGKPVDGIPQPGTVWADSALLTTLGIAPGGEIKLGERRFRVAGVIAAEPDRGASFVNFAPRVMLALADLPSTGLVQDGSRVTYRLLVAGPEAQVAQYGKWIEQRIKEGGVRGVRIETLQQGRPEMGATLARAERFLSLVALLSAMLAAVAVAMAARRFMLRHVDACAMLRCLGLTQNQTFLLYVIEFLLVGLLGCVLGAVLGYAAHFVLIEWLGKLVTTDLPPASIVPALQSAATGMVLLAGFALPPILQLRDVPHNRVIRREQDPPRPLALATYGLGLAAFTGLLLWQAGDLKLGLLTAGGFLGGFCFFALVAWLALKALRPLRGVVAHPAWRFAVTSLRRRPGATVVQVVALALGLMALLLLTVIRGDLVAAWRNTTPPDAPNRFVINIQPDQKDAIAARLHAAGVRQPLLFPMIRGRLTAVNGKPVGAGTYAEDRARRLVEREFNLSTMRLPPAENPITAGRWYSDAPGTAEASVEAGLAATLGLKLGDRMRFDVGGMPVEATVTSLRKVDWSSMRVNFFVIVNPAAMQDTPQTWITAFHLPETQRAAGHALVRDFPNLTMIDVGSVLRQIQEVLDQVIAAVEFLFLFTLASGLLVLYAALMGSQAERMREAALLRALGATRRQLSQAQWVEFLLVGGLAGLLAASGAAACGWLLAAQVFDFAWSFKPLVWVAGIGAGVACALIGGWLGLRAVLTRPPLATLREA
jgi:putative ABC transport system permease protein